MNVSDIIGKEVLDKNANKFGKVVDVDLDFPKGAINYLVIKIGLTKKVKVMVGNIERIGDRVILNVTKEELVEVSTPSK